MIREQQAATGKLTLSILIHATTPGAIYLSALAPAVFGVFMVMEAGVSIMTPLVAVAVLIPMLFNASVNLINEYCDYVSGNDTLDTIYYEGDNPLVYNNISNPKPVFWCGLLCLLVGVLLGIYVIYQSGPLPAIIGAVGAVTVLTYSGGKKSVSYLPLGEPVAGFALGGLVPLGVYASLTGQVEWLVLYKSIPMMLIVSQFMLVNNTCDIERDVVVGRRTLPILIGRDNARKVAAGYTFLWIIVMLHTSVFWYTLGCPLILGMLFKMRHRFRKIYTGERLPSTKPEDTWNMVVVASAVGICYPLSVLVHILLIRLLMIL